MARPQSISDKHILVAAYELLMEVGLRGFTFEKLGNKVGLVPAALLKRFKNKQQLLLAIDRYALEMTDKEVAEAMARTKSPTDAIIAQFTAELAFASTIERFANGQEFLLADFRIKELYDNYRISFERRHAQIASLLQQAAKDGYLQGAEDYSELAQHLIMLLHGSGHVWAMTQGGSTIQDYIRRHVHFALRPYMVKTQQPTSS
jgi:AcrR family transcriptional regulator